MNWSIILQSAIVSATITLLGTFLANIYLKRLDFKYNYRSFILSKRQQAYKEAESVITDLLIKTNYTANPMPLGSIEIFQLAFLADKEKLEGFQKKITELMNYNFWFTSKFREEITELYKIITFYYISYDQIKTLQDAAGIALFVDQNGDIEAAYSKLSTHFLKDIKNLDSLSFLEK